MAKKKSTWGGPRRPGPGKRMGRPPKESPLADQLTFQIDRATKAVYQALCSREGLTPSDDLRRYVEERIRKSLKP